MKKADELPPGELIGYARVSTEEQSLALQTDALKAAGCSIIREEKVTGSGKKARPQLDLAIKDLRPRDTLLVWRIDRLARSGRELYSRLEQIEQAGAGFKSLQEGFDFSTSTGRFVLGILGLVAELERQMTIERTKAGMAALKARGKTLGAERKVDNKMRAAIVKMVLADPMVPIKVIAKKFKIGTASFNGNFVGGKRGILKAHRDKKRKR
ncbi:MAG: recombinase family protein [Sulfuricaulis sp.]|nr:recombinase family protein [Sulfuricaulis sp.]